MEQHEEMMWLRSVALTEGIEAARAFILLEKGDTYLEHVTIKRDFLLECQFEKRRELFRERDKHRTKLEELRREDERIHREIQPRTRTPGGPPFTLKDLLPIYRAQRETNIMLQQIEYLLSSLNREEQRIRDYFSFV
jgi:hypothetical protein